MSIILRLAGRHINRRFFQSLLFILGVALGVAVIIAIDIANSSAKRAFSLSAESVIGRATHQVVGGPGGLSSDLYREIRLGLGIRESAPIIEERVRGLELNGQTLRLLGVDLFAEPPFRDYLTAITVGKSDTAFESLNAFITQPNAVLISRTLADRFSLQQGDSITLRANARTVPVQIIGILEPDDQVSEQALDDLVLADIATVQEIVNKPGVISRIDLILPPESNLKDSIGALLPQGTRLITPDEGNDTLSQMTEAFELNLQALSLLALVVGVFLIYNTVTFSVVQRRPVIGILRSLGTTQQQIFVLILGEAFLLGLIGAVLGVGLGILFGRAAVAIVAQTINDLYFTVNVQRVNVALVTLLKGAGIGLGASVGAALLPALNATRTPPAGTMRRSEQEQSIRKLVPTITVLAILMNVIGLILLQLPTNDIRVAFTALFAIVVGGAFFTPIVLILAMKVSTPLADRLFGVVGRMAPRAVTRSLSRTAIAVAALTIAVSVIVGVSVMIASFRTTVSDWLLTTLAADIFVSPPQFSTFSSIDVDPAVRDIMRSVAGVAEVSASREVQVSAPDYPDMLPVNLQVVDFDIAASRTFIWKTTDDYPAALQAGQVAVTEPFAYRRNITPENNTITLLTDEGPQTFEIMGVFYDYSTDQGKVYMANDVYRNSFGDPFISAGAARIEPDADLDTVITNMRAALADYDLIIQANRELRAGVFEIFDNAFSITVALRLLATVVAFIGILSALLALQLENTRQYGVMRANGMTPRQLWNFTLIQTGLMGIVAGILALPIGLALSFVLMYVINVRSFGWTMAFHFVPMEFVEAFMVAVLAALLAGLYPAYKLTRLLPARALRSE